MDEVKGLAIARVVVFHLFPNYSSNVSFIFIKLDDTIDKKIGFVAVSLFFAAVFGGVAPVCLEG